MATYVEKNLGQLRPANTNAASLYATPAATTTIITSLTICNTTAAPALYRIFHDDNGSTYDETTALAYDSQCDAYGTVIINKPGWSMNDNSGNLAVRSSVASALTFTAYGVQIS